MLVISMYITLQKPPTLAVSTHHTHTHTHTHTHSSYTSNTLSRASWYSSSRSSIDLLLMSAFRRIRTCWRHTSARTRTHTHTHNQAHTQPGAHRHVTSDCLSLNNMSGKKSDSLKPEEGKKENKKNKRKKRGKIRRIKRETLWHTEASS